MTYEYEYRYPPDAFDKRNIMSLSKSKVTKTLLVNTVYASDHPDQKHLYIRIRTQYTKNKRGPTIAESYLTVKSKKKTDAFDEEYETSIPDPAATREILVRLGCREVYRNEKFRDIIRVPDLGEIDFDEFPGVPFSLMEIESPTKAKLGHLVRALGLKPPTKAMVARAQLRTFYADLYGFPTDHKLTKDVVFSPDFSLDSMQQHAQQPKFRRILEKQCKRADAFKSD